MGDVTPSEREHSPSGIDGEAPPLRWWMPAAVIGALMALVIVVVVLLVRPPGPLDDPRPAFQRDGLLREGAVLDLELDDIELGGRTVVLLFERGRPVGDDWERWRAEVTENGVELVVLTPDDAAHDLLVAALPMPVPVDGGPPVGYAVIDPDRQVRYVTLDPQYRVNAFEVDVITGAVS